MADKKSLEFTTEEIQRLLALVATWEVQGGGILPIVQQIEAYGGSEKLQNDISELRKTNNLSEFLEVLPKLSIYQLETIVEYMEIFNNNGGFSHMTNIINTLFDPTICDTLFNLIKLINENQNINLDGAIKNLGLLKIYDLNNMVDNIQSISCYDIESILTDLEKLDGINIRKNAKDLHKLNTYDVNTILNNLNNLNDFDLEDLLEKLNNMKNNNTVNIIIDAVNNLNKINNFEDIVKLIYFINDNFADAEKIKNAIEIVHDLSLNTINGALEKINEFLKIEDKMIKIADLNLTDILEILHDLDLTDINKLKADLESKMADADSVLKSELKADLESKMADADSVLKSELKAEIDALRQELTNVKNELNALKGNQ